VQSVRKKINPAQKEGLKRKAKVLREGERKSIWTDVFNFRKRGRKVRRKTKIRGTST